MWDWEPLEFSSIVYQTSFSSDTIMRGFGNYIPVGLAVMVCIILSPQTLFVLLMGGVEG